MKRNPIELTPCKQVDNICYIYERDCKRSALHSSILLTAPNLEKNS